MMVTLIWMAHLNYTIGGKCNDFDDENNGGKAPTNNNNHRQQQQQ